MSWASEKVVEELGVGGDCRHIRRFSRLTNKNNASWPRTQPFQNDKQNLQAIYLPCLPPSQHYIYWFQKSIAICKKNNEKALLE